MRPKTPFHLLRYFSGTSLVVIAVLGVALALLLQRRAEAELLHLSERQNEAMTAVYLNALWAEFEPGIQPGAPRTAAALQALALERQWQARSAALMQSSQVVKIKVFALDGVTVFSTDPKQIGENKASNPGFVSARAGQPLSTLTHRERFDSFEGERSEVDLISSYLPVQRGTSVWAVFEVYQDVTPQVQRQKRLTRDLLLNLLTALFLLYGLQLLIVRRAQRILDRQANALRLSHRDLEARVQQRTQELEAATLRLDHLAHHDPLTGLPNRLLCIEHLGRATAKAARNQQELALLVIDLDRFKEINDTLGHAAGDELLCTLSTRLNTELRGGDLLARIGGDEFVCVSDCGDAATEAPRLAQRLLTTLSAPVTLGGQALRVSGSIGIALYPGDGNDSQALFLAADTAMYAAKQEGRNRYQFYRRALTDAALERAQLQQLLHQALAGDELRLHYQVKLLAQGGQRPAGAEALLRWFSPSLGTVPPARFIPVAEDCGLITELGQWVLDEACAQMVRWDAQGLSLPHISVNLSVRQLERIDFLQTLTATLARHGLAPERLELEITESIILNAENAVATLANIATLGVRLALDDFGTGYSSLSYLKQMPIQSLKIDRSFVMGIGEQRGDEAIIRTVIALARSLNLHTVAEGVESDPQLEFLREEGCEQVQGYLLGRPQPPEAFLAEWGG
ncbi:diguanylate cyclase (GGDEF)-like protein [Inhella inkyongensis]|uniref:Diguanylate cyclase (GGDEF)-like protein n=1 Tax=Inhella inkyongensis TaxID=392593 RepID=A0A840S2E2_9BURK|nr:EAL domain-containing protein [Inhella inkyongensis]MBB5202709.1 diguanylate cyclase (GGDEF)-like protein [Inhella inkyongensis]